MLNKIVTIRSIIVSELVSTILNIHLFLTVVLASFDMLLHGFFFISPVIFLLCIVRMPLHFINMNIIVTISIIRYITIILTGLILTSEKSVYSELSILIMVFFPTVNAITASPVPAKTPVNSHIAKTLLYIPVIFPFPAPIVYIWRIFFLSDSPI